MPVWWTTAGDLLRPSLKAAGIPPCRWSFDDFNRALDDAVQAEEVARRIKYHDNGYRRYEYLVHVGEERAWLDRLLAADAKRRLAA